jgi:predicted Rossmann-fold nucleotide-binding protein
MLTWAQLKIHEKPCAILNCFGFFDGLLGFLDHQVKQGFVTPKNRALLLEAAEPEPLLALMKPHLRRNGITNLA